MLREKTKEARKTLSVSGFIKAVDVHLSAKLSFAQWGLDCEASYCSAATFK